MANSEYFKPLKKKSHMVIFIMDSHIKTIIFGTIILFRYMTFTIEIGTGFLEILFDFLLYLLIKNKRVLYIGGKLVNKELEIELVFVVLQDQLLLL